MHVCPFPCERGYNTVHLYTRIRHLAFNAGEVATLPRCCLLLRTAAPAQQTAPQRLNQLLDSGHWATGHWHEAMQKPLMDRKL